ncbi:hypothetical protein OF83DRAFT_649169 [Amylostereum chailletii]|nr:hypothetical protein OF83DRAFT_649169 [Amylostereum chailletii]
MGVPIQGATSYLQQIMAGQLATNQSAGRPVQRLASGTSSLKPDAVPAPPPRSLRSTPNPQIPVTSHSRNSTPVSASQAPTKTIEAHSEESGTQAESRSPVLAQVELPPSLRRANISSESLDASPYGSRPPSALNGSMSGLATKRKNGDTDLRERNAKRPRTTEPYRRHERFWLPRGEAIIRLDDVIFKISMSLLEENSIYFAELFARPQVEPPGAEPPGAERQHYRPMLDGRTVYDVEKSNPTDFAHLLDVLYHTAKFITIPPSFEILASVLRASSALAFPDLFHWAVIRLENMWPADPPCTPGHVLPHAIETIILAKQYNVPRVLKRAMYEAARSPLYGHSRDNNNGVQNADVSTSTTRAQLSPEELLAIINASHQLSHAWMDIVSRPPKAFLCTHRPVDSTTNPPQSPSPKAHSETVVLRWSSVVLGSGLSRQFLNDPILGLTALRKNVRWKEHGFCERCVADARDVWSAHQRELWKNLDGWFSLV